MIRIHVKGDRKTRKALDRLVDKQIPFAASLAVNTTLTKVRNDDVWRQYEKTFNARNKQFFKLTHTIFNSRRDTFRSYGYVRGAIMRNEMPALPGTKKGRTKTSIEGPMTKRRVDTSFMEFHVSGGQRKPLRAVKAVPITKGRTPPLNITRTKTGKVTKAKKASTLYPQDRTFVRNTKKGKSVMFVRTGKKTLKAAYHFQPSVKIKRKYDFEGAARRGVNARVKFEFKKAYIRSLKTARL